MNNFWDFFNVIHGSQILLLCKNAFLSEHSVVEFTKPFKFTSKLVHFSNLMTLEAMTSRMADPGISETDFRETFFSMDCFILV